jgi:hypothetical protein
MSGYLALFSPQRSLNGICSLARFRAMHICFLSFSLGFAALNAAAQQVPRAGAGAASPITQQSTNPTTPPDYVVYHQFFRHLLFLDKQAASAAASSAQPVNPHPVNSYQAKLHFTGDQFAQVRSSATATEQQVAVLDAQAKAIVTAFRAQNQQVSGGNRLPPPPAQLAQLQLQRNTLIQNQIAQLKGSLGALAAGQLDTFLRTNFATHITIATVGPPDSHNPALHPLQPFERIN